MTMISTRSIRALRPTRRAPDLRSARVKACRTLEEAMDATLDEALEATCRSCAGPTDVVDSWNEHDAQHGIPMLRIRHACLHCADSYDRIHQVPLEEQYRVPLWDALTTGTRLMGNVTLRARRAAKALGVTSMR